jgi:hypothetical protein
VADPGITKVTELDIQLARLELKHENLREDHGDLLRRFEVMERTQVRLQSEYDKWLNRGIGIGLAITMLGAIGGWLLAQLKAMKL